jgi:hypothetical protein
VGEVRERAAVGVAAGVKFPMRDYGIYQVLMSLSKKSEAGHASTVVGVSVGRE